MKKTFRLITICAALAALALPAFANEMLGPDSAIQDQCTDDNKRAWYESFTATRTSNPTQAYEAAKKYLGACPDDADDITAYLKKWVAAYDKEARKLRLPALLYNDKKYAEAYALGREILADEPENLKVFIDLGYGGFLATTTAKNESFNNEAIGYARKAIQMIEAGKAPAEWLPFTSKDDALAYLHYTVGFLTIKNNPSEALSSLIKSAKYESKIKATPSTYYFIAAAYEAGPYAKLSADYKARFEGKDESPESKLALENINQVIDRMIDAYARAVALAGKEPANQASKTEWLQSLTEWYKFRNNQSDAGLNEMIASILSKPLPAEPSPITTLPAAAPASTPTSGSASPVVRNAGRVA